MKVSRRYKKRVEKNIMRTMKKGEKYTTNEIREKINRSHKFTEKRLKALYRKNKVNREKNGRITRWYR